MNKKQAPATNRKKHDMHARKINFMVFIPQNVPRRI